MLGLTVGALVAGGLVLAPTASATSTTVVINEVYGGGGNSGAPYKNDFIELRDLTVSGAPVDLSNWSVQYLPASPGAGTLWSVTRLDGSVAPGSTYLVGEGAGAGGNGADLPTPDAAGTLAMSGTAGTVALVRGTDALTCRNAADCTGDPRVQDLVGYGTASGRAKAAQRRP